MKAEHPLIFSSFFSFSFFFFPFLRYTIFFIGFTAITCAEWDKIIEKTPEKNNNKKMMAKLV